ncbi:MAG: hypothetical protein SFV52_02790 [Saprospiraceae bacterium]|nr:hypothetical protein [Saprospiraceae bacterium]
MPACFYRTLLLTDERLTHLLENPDSLASISFEELKTLALAYPYAQNLRYLLAIKAQMVNHPDAERMMATASVYSIDRSRLFNLFHEEPAAETADMKGVAKFQSIEPDAPEAAPQKAAAPHQHPPVPEMPEAVVADIPSAPEPIAEQPLPPEGTTQAALNGQTISFAEWYGYFNLPVLTMRSARKKNISEIVSAPAEPQTAMSGVAQELARESVREKPHLYSETLVRLLLAQGHTDRAIAMLDRMRLDIPEKSAYFAAEIEKLKK